MTGQIEPLRVELSYFESQLSEWIKHYEGQFALIKSQELLGTYPTQRDAVEVGLTRLGNVPFLVKQVLRSEPITTNPSFVLGLLHAHS